MATGSAGDGATNPEKPFKSIEVVDSRNGQVCKVACMSCIRGHRTTSCGIRPCRRKIFWTVKRPGRPSNSCTCRYGVGGGCKCVVAKAACPHKPKKGEKRSDQCRCDEQGRYCCLIEDAQWDDLKNGGKPTVTFFPSCEELTVHQASAKQARATPMPLMPTVAPHIPNGELYGIPAYHPSPISSAQLLNQYNAYQPTPKSSPIRFGLLGLGGPQGSPQHTTLDVLRWKGDVPLVPQDVRQHMSSYAPSESRSCCQRTVSDTAHNVQPTTLGPDAFVMTPPPSYDPNSQALMDFTSPTPTQYTAQPLPSSSMRFDESFARQQQRVNPICQNCGLGGCNCRHCPPVFQNPYDGSWGQGCGRKHARETPPLPPWQANKVARLRANHTTATRSTSDASMMVSPPLSPGLQTERYTGLAARRITLAGLQTPRSDVQSEFDREDPMDPTSFPGIDGLEIEDLADTPIEGQEMYDFNLFLHLPPKEEDMGGGGCCGN